MLDRPIKDIKYINKITAKVNGKEYSLAEIKLRVQYNEDPLVLCTIVPVGLYNGEQSGTIVNANNLDIKSAFKQGSEVSVYINDSVLFSGLVYSISHNEGVGISDYSRRTSVEIAHPTRFLVGHPVLPEYSILNETWGVFGVNQLKDNNKLEAKVAELLRDSKTGSTQKAELDIVVLLLTLIDSFMNDEELITPMIKTDNAPHLRLFGENVQDCLLQHIIQKILVSLRVQGGWTIFTNMLSQFILGVRPVLFTEDPRGKNSVEILPDTAWNSTELLATTIARDKIISYSLEPAHIEPIYKTVAVVYDEDLNNNKERRVSAAVGFIGGYDDDGTPFCERVEFKRDVANNRWLVDGGTNKYAVSGLSLIYLPGWIKRSVIYGPNGAKAQNQSTAKKAWAEAFAKSHLAASTSGASRLTVNVPVSDALYFCQMTGDIFKIDLDTNGGDPLFGRLNNCYIEIATNYDQQITHTATLTFDTVRTTAENEAFSMSLAGSIISFGPNNLVEPTPHPIRSL